MITDSVGSPISQVNVIAEDIATEEIISYAITTGIGSYEMSFNHSHKVLRIKVRSMGYKEKIVEISNRDQVKDFVLITGITLLEEVVLKSLPMEQTGDTLRYQPSSFAHKSDRSISDVLKHMPGITIKANGQILYEGKPINKFYIQGMDLLGGKYNLASKNLPHKEVVAVKIIENHQPIKALDGVIFSDNAALSIELKNEYTFTGQAELGGGVTPLLWDANLTPMLFTANRQYLMSYQTNNIGTNLSKETASLISDDYDNQKDSNNWLDIVKLNVPSFFSDKRWNDNNDHLVSANALEKLSNDYQLRLNVSYLNTYQQEEGESKTKFYTPTDTIPLYETSDNNFNSSSLEAKITIERNVEESYLKNSLDFQSSWDSQKGKGTHNNEPLNQYLKENYFKLSNQFKSIIPIGYQMLDLSSYILLENKPQRLEVTPSQFESLVNSDEFDKLTQDLTLNTLYTENVISYNKEAGYFTFSPKVGLRLESKSLETDLMLDDNLPLGGEFKNNLSWFSSQTYFDLSTQFVKGKWRIALSTPLNFQSFRIKDKSLEKNENLYRFTFDPRFSINYNVSSTWRLLTSASYKTSFGDINQIYPGYILVNYRNMQRKDVPLLKNVQTAFSGKVYYKNPLAMLMGNIGYMYNQSNKNLLFQTEILPDGATKISGVHKDNTQSQHQFSGEISKYFGSLNTSVKLNSDYSWQSLQTLINGVESKVRGENISFGGKLETEIFNWLRSDYHMSYFRHSNKTENQKARNTLMQSHKLGLRFYLTEKQNLGLSTEYVSNRLLNSSSENIFTDFTYQYRLSNLDFEIKAANIFGDKYYRNVSFTDYSYQELSYKLRPLQIVFKVRFSL